MLSYLNLNQGKGLAGQDKMLERFTNLLGKHMLCISRKQNKLSTTRNSKKDQVSKGLHIPLAGVLLVLETKIS